MIASVLQGTLIETRTTGWEGKLFFTGERRAPEQAKMTDAPCAGVVDEPGWVQDLIHEGYGWHNAFCQ